MKTLLERGKIKIKSIIFGKYSVLSYSQEGEDLILQELFMHQQNGFFVDIGAHHPQRFSNTYLLYLKGWRGINIDAMPGSMNSFKKIRPKDINLEYAVSDIEEELTYYVFNEPALNGFSKELKEERDGSKGYKVISEKLIKTRTLEWILDNYLPAGQVIDLLTIDVEGLDMKVLLSNNWLTYKPIYLIIEDLNFDIENTVQSEMYLFLKEKNYKLIAKTNNNLIFKHFFE